MATKADAKKAVQEAIKSMTGFDEIAVKQKFGTPIAELLQVDQLQGLRAILFVDFRRDGKKDDEAFHRVQELSINDVEERIGKKADGLSDFDSQPPTTTP